MITYNEDPDGNCGALGDTTISENPKDGCKRPNGVGHIIGAVRK